MEDLTKFEDSITTKIDSIIMCGVMFAYYIENFIPINKINKDPVNANLTMKNYSKLSLIFQIASSSLFFYLFYIKQIKNTEFYILGNLIGIIFGIEWFLFHSYFEYKNSLTYFIISLASILIAIIIIIVLIVFLSEVNKTLYYILFNLAFIFHVIMFISPGTNIIKLIQKKDPKFILIYKTITGLLFNIALICFMIQLCLYDIISFFYIIYPGLSFLIGIFEIIFYCKYKNNFVEFNENPEEVDKDKKGDLLYKNDV